MPECSVYGCTSGRKGSEKVQVFRYPKDDIMKKKWLKQIAKETVGKGAVICKKHFEPGYLKTSPEVNVLPTLLPNAIPTVFSFRPTPRSFKSKIVREALAQKGIVISVKKPIPSSFLHERSKRVTEKTPEERIKELESKLSAVSKENEFLRKIFCKEQQESINPDKNVDNNRSAPNCDDATENPLKKGLYFL